MGLFNIFKSDPNILRILAEVGILKQTVEQLIMATNNATAILSKQIVDQAQQLKADLDTTVPDFTQSLNNFKDWLTSEQAAAVVDPATLSNLQQASTLLGGFHSVVQSIDSAAKSADPGPAPASPVNG